MTNIEGKMLKKKKSKTKKLFNNVLKLLAVDPPEPKLPLAVCLHLL